MLVIWGILHFKFEKDSYEYFGHLNNQNRNKYWHKVIDVLKEKATENSLIFMNPNRGLGLSGDSKMLLYREDYVIGGGSRSKKSTTKHNHCIFTKPGRNKLRTGIIL